MMSAGRLHLRLIASFGVPKLQPGERGPSVGEADKDRASPSREGRGRFLSAPPNATPLL
jgi:hypothetical protein